jgi:hypothetical protein
MNLWQLTPDGLRELDTDGRRVRRIEGINLPTENEGRDGSWHPYFRVTNPVVVGEPIEIVWPARGGTGSALRSTITAMTVAVLDRPPGGPWTWAFGDEAGVAGLVSLAGEPVAQTQEIELAFVLAHLLNAAEQRPDGPTADRVVSTVRLGDEGHRAVLVAGVSVGVVATMNPPAERLVAALSRWAGDPEVVAALRQVATDLGGWEMVAVWDLSDPSGARRALVAGGLSAASVTLLDGVGPESFRHVARFAGRFGEALDWRDAVRAMEEPAPPGGPSVVERVVGGDLDGAAARTDDLVRRSLESLGGACP